MKRADKKAAIRAELLHLRSKNRLTPRDTVKTARNPDSAMHDVFIWDDAKAAAQQRLDQARALISDFQISYLYQRTEQNVVEFVHDPRKSDKQGYVSIEEIKTDSELKLEVMRQELVATLGHARRAQEIVRFLGFRTETQVLTDVVEKLDRLLE